jgi:hypothetical protein
MPAGILHRGSCLVVARAGPPAVTAECGPPLLAGEDVSRSASRRNHRRDPRWPPGLAELGLVAGPAWHVPFHYRSFRAGGSSTATPPGGHQANDPVLTWGQFRGTSAVGRWVRPGGTRPPARHELAAEGSCARPGCGLFHVEQGGECRPRDGLGRGGAPGVGVVPTAGWLGTGAASAGATGKAAGCAGVPWNGVFWDRSIGMRVLLREHGWWRGPVWDGDGRGGGVRVFHLERL